MDRPDNVALTPDGQALRIIDQTRLPGETVYLTLSEPVALREAIASLRVRGAPAIGIYAAFAMAVLARQTKAKDFNAFLAETEANKAFLDAARPTAVNLSKMTHRVCALVRGMKGAPIGEIQAAMVREATAIQDEDMAMCRAISEYGLSLLKAGDTVMTICNAGELATSRYGTALGPLLLAKEEGTPLSAWCLETRPLLQGARLTAYELQRAGIETTLICDGMAAAVMSRGSVAACLAGCDRVARNGDTANKIGTLGLAVLAKHYGVPFYVLGPSTTIDFACARGTDIVIEERPADEVARPFGRQTAPEGIACYNPAFDVTPSELITAIVTERGICRPPFTDSFNTLFREEMS